MLVGWKGAEARSAAPLQLTRTDRRIRAAWHCSSALPGVGALVNWIGRWVDCEHAWTVRGLWRENDDDVRLWTRRTVMAVTFGGALEPDSAPTYRPIACAAPLRLECTVCGEARRIACGTSRSDKCVPCATVYRQRVARVAGSGLVLGREGLFGTLTAPGAVQHRRRDGSPCPCTPLEGTDLAEWNASAGKRFNRFMRDLDRELGSEVVFFDDNGKRRTRLGLVYFKAAEVQRRGALHFHLLMRRRDGAPLAVKRSVFRTLAIKHGFGHSVDVQALTPGHATYVAKYVAKAANERADVPWKAVGYEKPKNSALRVHRPSGQLVDTRTGELVGPAVRELVTDARYRTWSASRIWGDSMAVVKLAQQHFVQVLSALPVWRYRDEGVPSTWGRVLAGVPPRPDAAVL